MQATTTKQPGPRPVPVVVPVHYLGPGQPTGTRWNTYRASFLGCAKRCNAVCAVERLCPRHPVRVRDVALSRNGSSARLPRAATVQCRELGLSALHLQRRTMKSHGVTGRLHNRPITAASSDGAVHGYAGIGVW